MSNWGSKLEKKLNALADSASKESIQTLSNWIGFNRKHAAIIAETLAKSLTSTSNSPARQWLYWQVVHELLLNGHGDGDESKWDKLMELRNQIGEQTVIPAMEQLGTDNIPPQVEPFVKQWGELNVFGGPTLVSQIKKLLTAEAKKTTSPAEPVPDAVEVKAPLAASSSSSEAAAATTTTTPTPAATSEPAEKKEEPLKIPDETSLQRRRSSLLSLSGKDIEYDFESKNIPQGKVESRQFLEPCKAIATLQIARDLRSDSAVQLSSLLKNLPEDIQATYKSGNKELDEATIRDLSLRMPSKLLDLDLEEQCQTVKQYQAIAEKQQAAREHLIHLLVKSRCQFGSQDAAKEFLELAEIFQKLKERQSELTDALELEGMDNEIDNTDFEAAFKELPKFKWYQPDGENDGAVESDSKKPRIE